MILRALWVAIGLHPQPFHEPQGYYFAMKTFAKVKDEKHEEEVARVDRRGFFERFGTALELWR
jgi:hypothetical protein